jgi:serine/threonine-protein kinase 24/25/MST4
LYLIVTQEAPKLTGSQWSDDFKEFVALCLEKEPSKRPSAKALLEHKFLARASDHKESFKQLIQFWKEKERLEKQLF